MPWSAPSICPAGHPHYRGDRCPACVRERQAAYDRTRPSAAGRMYDATWQRESKAFLAIHRWCVNCGQAATCVDHEPAHDGTRETFWDRSRWRPRCRGCHSRKTALVDSGFAGPRRF